MVGHFSKDAALGAQAVTIALYQDLTVLNIALSEQLNDQITSMTAESPSSQLSVSLSRNTLSLASSIAQAWFIKLIAFTGLIALSVSVSYTHLTLPTIYSV